MHIDMDINRDKKMATDIAKKISDSIEELRSINNFDIQDTDNCGVGKGHLFVMSERIRIMENKMHLLSSRMDQMSIQHNRIVQRDHLTSSLLKQILRLTSMVEGVIDNDGRHSYVVAKDIEEEEKEKVVKLFEE